MTTRPPSQSYSQLSLAYVNFNNGGWKSTRYNGTVSGPSGPMGTSYDVQVQCCYLDPCIGGQNTTAPNGVISTYCPYLGGQNPCICAQAKHYPSIPTTTCGIQEGAVCGSGGL